MPSMNNPGDVRLVLLEKLKKLDRTNYNISGVVFYGLEKNTDQNPIRNTRVQVSFKPKSGFVGNKVLNYNRVHKSELPTLTITRGSATRYSEVIPLLNSEYGLCLTLNDIVDDDLPTLDAIIDIDLPINEKSFIYYDGPFITTIGTLPVYQDDFPANISQGIVCIGVHKYELFSDGTGGNYKKIIELNSVSCGGSGVLEPPITTVPPITSSPPPTTSHTPSSTAPPTTTTPIPTTTAPPTSTAPPTTTPVPTTTAPPTTTLPPTTTPVPTTTAPPTTTLPPTTPPPTTTVPPTTTPAVYRPNGYVFNTYCTGYNKWNTCADGTGGTYEVMVEANSTACGFKPHGQLLSTHCDGFKKIGTYSDGLIPQGTYDAVIIENSVQCGYVDSSLPPPEPVLPVTTEGDIIFNYLITGDEDGNIVFKDPI